MKDLLIIPTFRRPEFLRLCLDYVAAAPESEDLTVWVVIDRRQHPPTMEELEVVAPFKKKMKIVVKVQQGHNYLGNSYNLMEAYKDAYKTDARYVFMVEDDVLVSPQFFQWHELVNHREAPTVSVGIKAPKHGAYASLGVCWPREHLQTVVAHARPEYYRDPRTYCLKKFRPSQFDHEQDGLIARCLSGQRVGWAKDEAKVQHVGWYGYHRPNGRRPQGTIDERYHQLKKILANPKLLKQYSKDFNDVHPLVGWSYDESYVITVAP